MNEIDQQILKNGNEHLFGLKQKMTYYIDHYVIDADINSEEETKQGLLLQLDNVLSLLDPYDEGQMAVVRLLNERLGNANSITLFTGRNLVKTRASSNYLIHQGQSFSITIATNTILNFPVMVHEIIHGCGNNGAVSEEVRDDILKMISTTEVNPFLKGLLKMKPERQRIEVLPHLIEEFFSRLLRKQSVQELTTFFPRAIESMDKNRESIFSLSTDLIHIKQWSRLIFNGNTTEKDWDELTKVDTTQLAKTVMLLEFKSTLENYFNITGSSKIHLHHYTQLCLNEPNLLTESTTFKGSSGYILTNIVKAGLAIIEPYIFGHKDTDGTHVYKPGLDLLLKEVGQLHKDISEKGVSNVRHTYLTVAVEQLGESKSEILLQNSEALIKAGCSPYHPDGKGRIPAEMIKELKKDPNKAHLFAQIERMKEAVKFFGDHKTIVEIDPLGNSGPSNSFKTSYPTKSPSMSPTPSPAITNDENALNGSESFDDASSSTNNSDYNSDNSLYFHDFQKFQNGMKNNLLETDLRNGLEITSTNDNTTSIQQPPLTLMF